MKTIDLANLIRSIRQEKLDEQAGGMGPYKGGDAISPGHGQKKDPSSPNKKIDSHPAKLPKKLEEDSVDEGLARSSYGSTKGNKRTHRQVLAKTFAKRAEIQGRGNQGRNIYSYTQKPLGEEEFVGKKIKTDTGTSADDITTNSKIDTSSDKSVSDKINTIKEQNKKRK